MPPKSLKPHSRIDPFVPVRDVRIVGGGLAGCITALELLNGVRAVGCRVTVYERETDPYTTLCGEGLSDRTLGLFTAFDSRPFVAESFVGAAWTFPGGVRILIDEPCHTMARERWIPAMAREISRLGGDYRTAEKIGPADVARLAREADLVVGADGPGSVVRKHVGGTHATGLGLQYRVARDAYDTERLEFVTDKRFSPEYAWIFPRGDLHNVGILADPAIPMDANWRRLDAFMEWSGVAAKVVKREAYPIGFFGTRVQRGNVVLVGDAAGLTNPVTKGGMAAAVHAAKILAECVVDDRVVDYERRVMAHPLATPLFHRAVDVLARWTNADFERLARFAPPTMRVGGGASGRRRYWRDLVLTAVANPTYWRDLDAVIRALGVSRVYSW